MAETNNEEMEILEEAYNETINNDNKDSNNPKYSLKVELVEIKDAFKEEKNNGYDSSGYDSNGYENVYKKSSTNSVNDPKREQKSLNTDGILNTDDDAIIETMASCLTFLLHHTSPLWANDEIEHHSVSKQGGMLTPNSPDTHKLRVTNLPSSSYQSTSVSLASDNGSPTPDTTQSFAQRCAAFQSTYNLPDIDAMAQIQKCKRHLEKIYNKKTHPKIWNALLQYWDSWQLPTKKDLKKQSEKNKKRIEPLNWSPSDLKCLNDNVDALITKKEQTNAEKDDNDDDEEEIKDIGDTRSEILNELKQIVDKKRMKEWLSKWKSDDDGEDILNLISTTGSEAIGAVDDLTGNITSKLLQQILGYELLEDKDLKLSLEMNSLPLKQWTYQHLNHWIETIDHLKHFASIFSEWRINGDELLTMNAQQIKLLIKESHNYRYNFYDIDDIKRLQIELEKCLIRTTVTFQYEICYNSILKIASKGKKNKKKCKQIFELLKFLRPQLIQGPKALWKLDAVYFSKIDNILSLLISTDTIKRLFKQCYPKYIFDNETHHTSTLLHKKSKGKRDRFGSRASDLYQHSQSFRTDMDIDAINKELQLSQAEEPQDGDDDDDEEVKDEKVMFTDDEEVEEDDNNPAGQPDLAAIASQINEEDEKGVEIEAEYEQEAENLLVINRNDDLVDRCADKCCCCDNKCSKFVKATLHNIDRIYCETLTLLLITISIGCIFVFFWMRSRSRNELDQAIDWIVESIALRAVQNLQYEFFIPQMLTMIAIGGLKDGDIVLNASKYTDGRFDEFFLQFTEYEVSADSIYGLYMHENISNSLIGGILDSNDDLLIFLSNGSLAWDYKYPRSSSSDYVANFTYNPRSRPWYQLAQEMDYGDFAWTEPYTFPDNLVGISLIQKILYNDVEVVFLVDFTMNTMNDLMIEFGNVDGGVTYLATPGGSVIASNNGEIDLNVNTENATNLTLTSNKMIKSSINFLRNGQYLNKSDVSDENFPYEDFQASNNDDDDYNIFLYSFSTTYLNGNNSEYNTIVVVYDNVYLDQISNARILAFWFFIGALLFIFCFICGMGIRLQAVQYQQRNNFKNRSSIMTQISSPENNLRTNSILSRDEEAEKDYQSIYLIEKEKSCCIFDHKGIIRFGWWYTLIIFVMTWYIWDSYVSQSLDTTTDAFLKQEYMIVQDQTINIINIADTILEIVEEKFTRSDFSLDATIMPEEYDVFFANLMNAFKYGQGDEDYYQLSVYVGTPKGAFIGARFEDNKNVTAEYKNTMRIMLRDNSTDWYFKNYALNDTTLKRRNITEPIFETDTYDPRCRPWYQDAVTYMTKTDLYDAFHGTENYISLWLGLDDSSKDTRFETDCIESIAHYNEIYDVTEHLLTVKVADGKETDRIGLSSNSIYNNSVKDQGIEYDRLWLRYVFAVSLREGLSVTKPIIDDVTGELLGVVSIDFTLSELSSFLNDTNNHLPNEDDWYTWIFDNNDESSDVDYAMIASSNEAVYLTCEEIESCDDKLDEIDEIVPYSAISHPEDIIRIMSKEITQFYINQDELNIGRELPINTTNEPRELTLPIDLPDVLAGKVQTFPAGYNPDVELNWILVKSVDIQQWQAMHSDDILIIGFVFFTLLTIIYIITDRFRTLSIYQRREDNSIQSKSDEFISKKEKIIKYNTIMALIREVVEGSSAEIWNILSTQQGNDYKLLTTVYARYFMAQESNKHMQEEGDEDLTLLLCSFQLENNWHAFRALKFIKSPLWRTLIEIAIFSHMIVSLALPDTEKQLKEDWEENYTRAAITATFICIIFEIIDVIFAFAARYIEFGALKDIGNLIKLKKAKYGSNHKYVRQIENKSILWLIFFGTSKWRIFQAHCFLVLLIVINAFMMISAQLGPFEYYIPVVPILLIIRSKLIRDFANQFLIAISLAIDVLISYLLLILIIAIISFSVFRNILNPDESVDTYSSSIRSMITSFAFISTGENYNSIVYNAIHDDPENANTVEWFLEIQQTISGINLVFFVLSSIVGLYFFIPIIIHKFEIAYDYSKDTVQSKYLRSKRNSVIAAFIMLDFNDDLSISIKEFQHLVHTSVISKQIIYDFFDDDEQNDDNNNDKSSISLEEFVSSILSKVNDKNDFATNPIKCTTWKLQSWLECNWYRRPKNRYYLLVYILIPSICLSILRGLGGIEDDFVFLDVMVHIFFFINFIDINCRWFAFGRKRFFSLNRYQNPPFVQKAIDNFVNKNNKNIAADNNNNNNNDDNDESQTILKLSHQEKVWASENLLPVRPESVFSKQRLSIIHKFETYIIWFGFIGWLITFIFPNWFYGYYYLFIQLFFFRLFSLVEANQKLIVLIFSIIPHFINLLGFLIIFIFFWARIGCTIFGDNTQYVIDDIFSSEALTNFDTLGSSILTLLQLMIGEGWHEIMYINIIANGIEYSLYFILYIIIVTLIISNIFVGLFLSEIEDLDTIQSNDELNSQYMQSQQYAESYYNFKKIAIQRKKELMHKVNHLNDSLEATKKQIDKIDKLLARHQRSNDIKPGHKKKFTYN